MTIGEWQTLIGLLVGVSTVAGVIFTALRFYIRAFAKQELEDIRHELKPNSGSSIKDQVTRLEDGHKQMAHDNLVLDKKIDKLESKIDKLYETIINHYSK